MEQTLAQIKKYAEDIAGNWNGKESGWAEEKAQIANEILEEVDSLEALLKELEDF